MRFPIQNRRLMIQRGLAAGLVFAAILAGCSKRDTPSPSSPTPAESRAASAQPQTPSETAALDACKLLTNEEIAAVQGEAPARTQLISESDGKLTVSQCNFLLPTGSSSMAVRVVERGNGQNARDPKEVWQETFHRGPPDSADARYARQPQKVNGVGEEAFWLGNAKSGGLHVLTGNRYIRVNVVGPEDVPPKIAKCSKLSQLVLSRLNAED